MRTIQLLDSQFNTNNKKLGRELMRNAEKYGLLADEQAGSRKARRAVTAALNKRLTLDILRQKKKAGIIISNDAVSCYDRVAHNVAILAMRRLGAPKSAVTTTLPAEPSKPQSQSRPFQCGAMYSLWWGSVPGMIKAWRSCSARIFLNACSLWWCVFILHRWLRV